MYACCQLSQQRLKTRLHLCREDAVEDEEENNEDEEEWSDMDVDTDKPAPKGKTKGNKKDSMQSDSDSDNEDNDLTGLGIDFGDTAGEDGDGMAVIKSSSFPRAASTYLLL